MPDDALELVLTFPVWLILIDPKGSPESGRFKCGGCHIVEVDGENALLVFSDVDILQRYLDANSLPSDLIPVAFQSPRQFLDLLGAVEKTSGVAVVAIDPWLNKTRLRIPIHHFIQVLTNGVESEGL